MTQHVEIISQHVETLSQHVEILSLHVEIVTKHVEILSRQFKKKLFSMALILFRSFKIVSSRKLRRRSLAMMTSIIPAHLIGNRPGYYLYYQSSRPGQDNCWKSRPLASKMLRSLKKSKTNLSLISPSRSNWYCKLDFLVYSSVSKKNIVWDPLKLR